MQDDNEPIGCPYGDPTSGPCDVCAGYRNCPANPHSAACGCEWRGGRHFRCAYHEGYWDGKDSAERIIREMQAKLDHANGRITREVMIDRIMEARR